MLRVELLIPTLVRSGAEKQLTLLACGLPKDQFDVRVTCLTSGGPYVESLRKAEIPVTILNKRFQFDPLAWWRLRRQLKAATPDILHTWLFAANSYGRMALPRSSHTKTIVSERCVDNWKTWQLWVDRNLVSRTDRLVGNSQAVVDFYRPLGYRDDQLCVIPNGVEVPPQPSQSRKEFLAEHALPSDAKLVFFAGRLAQQKRVPDLIWAMQLLRQADRRSYLIIVGDGPLRSSLEQHARDLEVEKHVRFLGHRSEAACLMHLADAVWLGSEFEGMSNSLMEAMACGRPIVATAIPPNQELIHHGDQGYLVNVGDSAGFAQYTLKFWNEPETAQAMGEAAHNRMATENSVGQMVRSYADLYRKLAQSTRR